MPIELLKSVPGECVTKQGGTEVNRKRVADMSDAELDKVLRAPGRVTQALVNMIWAEKQVRATNSGIKQARADQELLDEIREALTAEGKTEAVAINLTNTEPKMLAEGKRLGII